MLSVMKNYFHVHLTKILQFLNLIILSITTLPNAIVFRKKKDLFMNFMHDLDMKTFQIKENWTGIFHPIFKNQQLHHQTHLKF